MTINKNVVCETVPWHWGRPQVEQNIYPSPELTYRAIYVYSSSNIILSKYLTLIDTHTFLCIPSSYSHNILPVKMCVLIFHGVFQHKKCSKGIIDKSSPVIGLTFLNTRKSQGTHFNTFFLKGQYYRDTFHGRNTILPDVVINVNLIHFFKSLWNKSLVLEYTCLAAYQSIKKSKVVRYGATWMVYNFNVGYKLIKPNIW